MALPHVRPGVYAGSRRSNIPTAAPASFTRLSVLGYSQLDLQLNGPKARARSISPVNRAEEITIMAFLPRHKCRVYQAKGHEWPSTESLGFAKHHPAEWKRAGALTGAPPRAIIQR